MTLIEGMVMKNLLYGFVRYFGGLTLHMTWQNTKKGG